MDLKLEAVFKLEAVLKLEIVLENVDCTQAVRRNLKLRIMNLWRLVFCGVSIAAEFFSHQHEC